MRVVAGLLLATACAAAFAERPRVPRACRHALDRALPGWMLPRPTDEENEWSNSGNLDPAVAIGDFDGNGRPDVAVLLERDAVRKVAVCLSTRRGVRVSIIERPYTSGVIFTTPAGTRVDDLHGERRLRLPHDAVSTYDVGKAGATYVLASGRFREIVDSD